MFWFSVCILNGTSAFAVYVDGTCTIALPYLFFSSVMKFGALHFCLGYFDRIFGVASFSSYIYFILGDALGKFVDVLLASNLGAGTCQTADSVWVSSTECLLRSIGKFVSALLRRAKKCPPHVMIACSALFLQ